MATTLSPAIPLDWTVAELHEHLGGIPLERIQLDPRPGTATEEDVIKAERRTGRICELIDGVLVEKTVGWKESRVAASLIHILESFLDENNLGIVTGADGPVRLFPRQVRIPDVCFIAWEKFPDRQLPSEPIPSLIPDLAVEILSPGNTAAEMQRKLRDYFAAGVRLVWYIDPVRRNAHVYIAADQGIEIGEDHFLAGRDVLPGFELSLRELFAKSERRGPK